VCDKNGLHASYHPAVSPRSLQGVILGVISDPARDGGARGDWLALLPGRLLLFLVVGLRAPLKFVYIAVSSFCILQLNLKLKPAGST